MKTHEAWLELKLWIAEEIAYEGSWSETGYQLERVQAEMDRLESEYE